MPANRTLKPLAVLGVITALVAGGAGAATANPGGTPAIPLNTEQETTGSNTGASGFFSYTIEGGELCYTLTARNLPPRRGRPTSTSLRAASPALYRCPSPWAAEPVGPRTPAPQPTPRSSRRSRPAPAATTSTCTPLRSRVVRSADN